MAKHANSTMKDKDIDEGMLKLPVRAISNDRKFKKFLKSSKSGKDEFVYYPYYYSYPFPPQSTSTTGAQHRNSSPDGKCNKRKQHRSDYPADISSRMHRQVGSPRMHRPVDVASRTYHHSKYPGGTPGNSQKHAAVKKMRKREYDAPPNRTRNPRNRHSVRDEISTSSYTGTSSSPLSRASYGHRDSLSLHTIYSSTGSSTTASVSIRDNRTHRSHRSHRTGRSNKHKLSNLHITDTIKRSHSIVGKPRAKGTCFICNAISCGACDNPGGLCSWLNWGGCCDRRINPPSGCLSHMESFDSEDYRQALTHRKRGCCCNIE